MKHRYFGVLALLALPAYAPAASREIQELQRDVGLLQEQVTQTTGTVLRDNLVRLDSLPLVTRVPDLPPLAPESRVRLAIGRVDLLAATLEARYAGRAAD